MSAVTPVFRTFFHRCVRHLLLGTAVSVIPAAGFYLVTMPFTTGQMPVVLALGALTLAIVLPLDLWLLRRTLAPIAGALEANASRNAILRGYARLLDLPWLVLVRIFGPHALTGSAIMTCLIIAVKAPMQLELDWHDYAAFWFFSLTIVPIGHVVYEFTAVERDSHALANLLAERLSQIPAQPGEPAANPRSFTLATRMRIFFPLLAIAPVAAVILAVLKRSEGLADFKEHLPMLIDMVVIGTVAAAFFVFLMYRLGDEISFQTSQLTSALDRLAVGNLSARVELHATSEFGQIAQHVNAMAGKLAERQHLRDLFGAYMTPEVAEKLLEAGATGGSEVRHVAVLFVDVRGFTAFSRGRSPRVILAVLNQFLEEAVEAVAHARGTVNKYLGDGLLAVFGAPIELENPCASAFQAGLELCRRLRTLNSEFVIAGIPELRIGIGVHAGDVVVGSIGSAKYKLEYTVIGDAVNVASRIEQLTKTVGVEMLVSAEVFADLTDSQKALCGPALEEQVRGVEKPVTVHAIDTGLVAARTLNASAAAPISA